MSRVCLEQTLRILLSEYTVTAWRSTQFIVYNDIRARIIAVHLLVKDNLNNEVGNFLISLYALIRNLDQKLWDSFIEKLKIFKSRKYPIAILVIGATLTQVLEFQTNPLTTVL